jgi:CheY-like chemotaxis protein
LQASVFLVALTGYAQPEDQQMAREAGFDAHVAKPADMVALRRLLVDRSDGVVR